MTKNKSFKYQRQLEELLLQGCQLPKLYKPNDMHACRFAFSSGERTNHLPQYVSNPKRMLQDIKRGKSDTSLLALSCFDSAERAVAFYKNLTKAFKNTALTIGDALAEGNLSNDDGLKSSTGQNGHFDFYEYVNCDLNKSFHITKQITEDKYYENN